MQSELWNNWKVKTPFTQNPLHKAISSKLWNASSPTLEKPQAFRVLIVLDSWNIWNKRQDAKTHLGLN